MRRFAVATEGEGRGASRWKHALLGVFAAVGVHGAYPTAVLADQTRVLPWKVADFRGEHATGAVRHVADWAVHSGDHEGLPFIVVDKRDARLYVFDAKGKLLGNAPVLLGRGVGDAFEPGVMEMDMYDTKPWQRVTPAGRFRAEQYENAPGKWILWVHYDSGIAIHKVLLNNAAERRGERIKSPDPNHRRITYGCINVPVRFYDAVIHPTFRKTEGIVYVLPETQPLQAVFDWYEVPRRRDFETQTSLHNKAAAKLLQPTEPIVKAVGLSPLRVPQPLEQRQGALKALPHARRLVERRIDDPGGRARHKTGESALP